MHLLRRLPKLPNTTSPIILSPLDRQQLPLPNNGSTAPQLLQAASNGHAGFNKFNVTVGDRVGILATPNEEFVKTMLACWRAGVVAVPLCPTHPPEEWRHTLQTTQTSTVVSPSRDSTLATLAQQMHIKHVTPTELLLANPASSPPPATQSSTSPAAILMTSGSTALPKGVVWTHGAIEATCLAMESSWQWTSTDSILHFLPLHHVHGLMNKLLTPLGVGARVEFTSHFDANEVLTRLSSTNAAPTVFMGVPTIYTKLMNAFDETKGHGHMKNLRLFVCGSAPLPAPLFELFLKKTSHRILERYGMTETGMVLSNPLYPETDRLPGYVGKPMPGVAVQIRHPDGSLCNAGDPGELMVKGPSVFSNYFGYSEENMSKMFDQDGWFATGDIAVLDASIMSYKILGRASVDIIKSGGYKISALEIESAMLSNHDAIREVAVVGVPDEVWGEAVAMVWCPTSKYQQSHANEQEMNDDVIKWAKTVLAPYKVPRRILNIDAIPRNAMGKFQKKDLRRLFV